MEILDLCWSCQVEKLCHQYSWHGVGSLLSSVTVEFWRRCCQRDEGFSEEIIRIIVSAERQRKVNHRRDSEAGAGLRAAETVWAGKDALGVDMDVTEAEPSSYQKAGSSC